MLDEFFQQGDLEAAQGLPVSPLMDRSTTSLAISQINFIEFVVAPLFLQVRTAIKILMLVTLALSSSHCLPQAWSYKACGILQNLHENPNSAKDGAKTFSPQLRSSVNHIHKDGAWIGRLIRYTCHLISEA